jgi:hypothetical protein
MPIEGLTANSFDVLAVLTKSGRNASRREAPLGLLLNRIKRMPVAKRNGIEVLYGGIAFNARDIALLIDSEEYEAWLKTPRVTLRWWPDNPRRQRD